jgi:hypothetical protein
MAAAAAVPATDARLVRENVVTVDERAYLLERCLRLEAQIAMLQGHTIALSAPTQRWSFDGPLPSVVLKHPKHQHRIRRAVTTDEIMQMRNLRRRGMAYEDIARRMARSTWTARRHTFDIAISEHQE